MEEEEEARSWDEAPARTTSHPMLATIPDLLLYRSRLPFSACDGTIAPMMDSGTPVSRLFKTACDARPPGVPTCAAPRRVTTASTRWAGFAHPAQFRRAALEADGGIPVQNEGPGL